MAEPIRILHVLGNTRLGGAESRTMDLYRHLDREKIQFDFLVHTQTEGYFDEEIGKLGGRIYRVPRFRLYNYFSYRKAMKDFFADHHEFRAVQGHMTSTAAIYLPIAKKAGVSMTIAHARSAGVDKGLKGILTQLLRRDLAQKADHLFSCSEIAGEAVFGKRAVEEGRVKWIPNAIDTGAFAYDELRRHDLRRELKISEDAYVLGHVGRFHYAKNHEYLLRVFAELCKEDQKQDYVLMLLGEGAGMEAMKALAGELGIDGKVLFLGNKSNCSDYYQAMDYFVYPSRFEGLPGAVVEAQCAGLKCLMSDQICREVAATDLVKTMSITVEPEQWAAEILKTEKYERRSRAEEMAEAGFDVKGQAASMTEFYTTEKRKLMLISPMLHQGGFERVCVTTARLLGPYFDVTIVIFDSADIAYDVSGLQIVDLKLGVQKGIVGKIINVIRRSRRLKQLKKSLKPQIAYSFGLTANMVNACSKTAETKGWLGLRSYWDLEEKSKMQLFMRQADRIICCSKAIERELINTFQYKKAAVLYNPFDVETIREGAALKDAELPWEEKDEQGRKLRILISMGRDDDTKGFWHMLKTFALVYEKHPEARLVLMGEGSFQDYRKLSGELGISDAVFFAGLHRNPYCLLKKGEIYLLTSLTEGFPNALVEGMALELAAVSVDCQSGPAEILLKNDREHTRLYERTDETEKCSVLYGDYGILLPAADREKNMDAGCITEKERDMAQVIIELLEDQELLDRYQKAAAERVQAFTYESYVKRFMELALDQMN